MITAPTVNRIPAGLLGFLGIKNGGRNPESLNSNLTSSLELFDWYMGTNRQFARTTGNVAALGTTNYFTVPNGEYWYVEHAAFVTQTIGAGQTLEAVITLENPAGLAGIILSGLSTARTTGQVFVAYAGGFWANPGERIGVYTTQLVAGPIVLPSFTLAYCPLGT